MLDPKKIFPIGIGTWGIGGLAKRDPKNNDKKQIKALKHMLENGMNFAEMCYFYADGYATKLFIEALEQTSAPRDDLFIVVSVYPYKNKDTKEARNEFEHILNLFSTSWMDSIQFTSSGLKKWGLKNSIKLQKELLKEKLVRYVSVTNADLDTLKIYYKEFGNKFFSHEVHYSFELRENEDFGLIPFTDNKGIKNVIFQPIRRNNTAKRNWPLLVDLSKKYSRSQNQIIFNWLVSKGFFPITKSENIKHIDEIIGSLDFKLELQDLDKLNTFRVKGYETPKIDWKRTGEGVVIHQLPNIVDDIIDGKYEER